MHARLRPLAALFALLAVLAAVQALAIPTSRGAASRSHRRTLLPRQGDGTTEAFLAALRDAKLTKLAALLNDHPAIMQHVSASPGLKTLLAPIDDALPLPSWSNTSAVLLYHFLNGTIGLDDYPTLPQHAVVHSFLTDATGANLPGGNGQGVALSTGATHGTYDEDRRQVNEAINDDAFYDRGSIEQSTIRVGQYTILPIRRAMTIPGNATFTARAIVKRTAFVDALQKSSISTTDLDLMRGSTMFVPSNAAMAAFKQKHANLSNETMTAVLRNHLVAFRAAYSALLTPHASLISMGGQDMHVSNSSSQMRVSVGNASATITQTDVMHYGGVMHLIDAVLVDAAYDQQRAERAANSAQASANSYVAGVVSTSNAASSQGTEVPPSPAGSDPAAQNSSITNTFDAASGNSGSSSSNGQGSTSGRVTSGNANASTSYSTNLPSLHCIAALALAVMAAILVPHP